MSRKPRGYFDAADLPENKRCSFIAKQIAAGDIVAFIVEDDGKKADRYVKKITNRCKRAIELDRTPGPIDGCVVVRMSLPEKAEN